MTKNTHKDSHYVIVDSMRAMMASEGAVAHILSKAGEEMIKLQSEPVDAWFNETVPALVPQPGPAGAEHLLWQVPAIYYQAQSRRMVRIMLDTYSIVSRAQQRLLDWGGSALLGNVQQTAQAMSRLNGALANRRESATVIDFADRRLAMQAVAESAANAEGRHSSHRGGRQAAA